MPNGTVFSNDFLVSATTAAAYYIPDFITVKEEEYLLRKIDESPKLGWKTLGCNYGVSVPVCYVMHLAELEFELYGFGIGGEIQRNVLFRKELPTFLTSFPNVIGRLKATGAFEFSPHKEPNHVILNEYHPGQGIMPHEDGPLYYPVVGTLSLGSHTVFHYYAYDVEGNQTPHDVAHTNSGRAIYPNPVLSVFLEPRSVIITTGDLYTSHLHGIDETTHDTFVGDGRLLRPSGDEVMLSNWRAIRARDVRDMVRYGGTLSRQKRCSLTCRDVEKVATPINR